MAIELRCLKYKNEAMTRFWRTVRRKSNPVDPEVNKRILKNLPKEKKKNYLKLVSSKEIFYDLEQGK